MVQRRGDSGARSLLGAAGLRWRGRGTEPWGSQGLSGLVLEHPSLSAPRRRCQAAASGLCPCAVPGANNTREEAVRCRQRLCPEPTPGSDAFPERVLPRPPAPARRPRRHVPGAAAASSRCPCACCQHSPAACRLSRCPPLYSSLAQLFPQLCLGVMQMPPLFLLLHPTASAQLPSFISVPNYGCWHWIFSFENSLKQGCWLQTGFIPISR